VGAEDVGGGLLKDGEIERVAARPDIGGEHGRADASGIDVVPVAGEDAILVGFAQGAVAGVEVFGDCFNGEDTDACRESAVKRAVKIGGRDRNSEGEGGDLSEGVDAGIGAAGALREDSLAGDAMDCACEGSLNGGEIGLDLPSVVGSSVVGEGELPVWHG